MSGERKWARRMRWSVALVVLVLCVPPALSMWPTETTVSSNSDPWASLAELQKSRTTTTTTLPKATIRTYPSNTVTVLMPDGRVVRFPNSPAVAILVAWLDRL